MTGAAWARISVLGAALLLLALPASRAADGIVQSWRWRVGDDPAWAQPDFNDESWEQGQQPAGLTLKDYPYRGWYRLHFTLPPDGPAGGWGIALGRILTADEAYLNGIYIGGEGRIQDRFVDALHKERVYPLPEALLRPGDNLLALRVQSSLADGGLPGIPVAFGDLTVLRRTAEGRAARRKLHEAFFFGMLFVALGFWILLLWFRARQSEYLYFGSFVGLFSAIWLLESLLWYDAGRATPLTQQLVISLYLLLPLPLILFGAQLMNGWGSVRPHQALAGACAVFSSGYLVLGDLRSLRLFENLWWLMILATGLLLAYQAWRLRLWKQSAAPLALAIGVALLLLFALLEQFAAPHWAHFLPFGALLHFGFACLIASLACALAIRFRALNERLRALSHHMLSAQETASKRSAATLHNELAPTLAAVKLDLQIFLRRHQLTGDGQRVVEQLGLAIAQARALSHEMHPVAVDQLGLAAALEALAQRLAEANGWILHASLDNPPGLNGRHAALLYRMGQELLYNAAKHAQAKTLFLTLTHDRHGTRLVIRDDGRGCDLRSARPGIGWYTLHERTNALRGRCEFASRPGAGLEAAIWLPHQ